MSRFILILFFLCILGCERPEPKYVLKSEVGEAAILHWEDLKEDTKFKKIKKTDIDKQRDLEKRRIARKTRKGRFIKTNPWDY